MARRQATQQLLRVSLNRLQKAQQKYLDWEAFSLWVRAIVDAEGQTPAWMSAILQKRCRGFLECEEEFRKAHPKKPGLLPLHLLEWIHNNIFADAKRERWLDAIIFYAVRDPRSQHVWAYWEHCERQWKHNRPASYPSFDEWRHAAQNYVEPGPN
jgi:hypothetical protein